MKASSSPEGRAKYERPGPTTQGTYGKSEGYGW